MKKVIILIDGQNLFYSLKDLRLIEKNIKWRELFASLLDVNDELIRTYWFRPLRIHDSHLTSEVITNQVVYKNFSSYYSDYKADKTRVPAHIITQIDTKVKECEDWLKKQKTRFSQIEFNYDQLSLEFEDIEMVRTGLLKVDPYKKIYLGEKGVDIALAVKMIALSVERKTDKIILVSGDFDYAEAIKFVKDQMTKIHIVKFHKGVPPINRNMARDLAVLADKVIDIYESDLKSKFCKPEAPTVSTTSTIQTTSGVSTTAPPSAP